MMRFDCDVTASEIQQLASADAVAAFFAKLGYRTDVRVPQTPGNLGITANGTVRPIKRVELIADQEGLLQVYLFELTTVPVTHTQALAKFGLRVRVVKSTTLLAVVLLAVRHETQRQTAKNVRAECNANTRVK